MQYDEGQAYDRLYDDIMKHAEKRMAEGYRSKYAPKMPEEPKAAAEGTPGESYDDADLETLASALIGGE